MPRINRISDLTRARPVLGIPFVTIQIQLIRARRPGHALLGFHRIDPCAPATPLLGLGPPAVRTQDAAQAEHPGRDLDVDEGEGGAEEEGACGVRRGDEFGDLVAQGLGVRGLVGLVLGLEEFVEQRDDVPVYVVGPEARGRAGLRVWGQEVRAGGQVFEVLHYHGGFVRAPGRAVPDCRDEAARVDVEQGLRLFVGVDFDVLVGYVFVLERDPDALDERA